MHAAILNILHDILKTLIIRERFISLCLGLLLLSVIDCILLNAREYGWYLTSRFTMHCAQEYYHTVQKYYRLLITRITVRVSRSQGMRRSTCAYLLFIPGSVIAPQ